jgi:fatty-acyl-CoA synthase
MGAKKFRSALTENLRRNADKVLLRVVLAPDYNHPVELTGSKILEIGRRLALEHGVVDRGRVVLLLLPHSVELFLLHLGLLLEGWLPAVLPWPTSRIDAEKYQRNLLHQLRNLPAAQLITLPRLVENLQAGLPMPAVACRFPGCEHFEEAFRIPLPLKPAEEGTEPLKSTAGPEDALFLQFSGGTTGAQKAVVVTAPMMVEQLDRLRDTLAFGPDDGVASWLPMYHDMGLIACLWLPLWYMVPSIQFSATDWLLRPDLLFHYLHRYRATYCWLPNFAFSYLAAQRERCPGPHSLGHVRGFINCSEPVRLRSVKAFCDAYAEWGVTPVACQASYAMAENVFAVTQTPKGAAPATAPRAGLRHRAVAYNDLAFDLLDDTYVSSGHPLPDMEILIARPDGSRCEPREPGEILLRTPCLFEGYWGSEGFIRSSISQDGWYSTGDYGFLDGPELYVIGRLKDIVIVGGQNVFPEDVESVVNTMAEIYSGRVVAFGVFDDQNGTEALAVVAELRGGYQESIAKAVERQIQQLVLAAIGIAPRFVGVVPERWIVKSTAGKISRRDTRQRFMSERLKRPLVQN